MRLNGWQRIGVLASIAWALAVILFATAKNVETSEAIDRERASEVAVADCRRNASGDAAAGKKCGISMREFLGRTLKPYSPSEILGAAFLPVLAGWLGVYMIIHLAAWVRRGFTSDG